MAGVTFNSEDKTPIYQQIVQYIIDKIERNIYEKDHHLLSINKFSKEHLIARDTIERAYKELKKQGYITAVTAAELILNRNYKQIKNPFEMIKRKFL